MNWSTINSLFTFFLILYITELGMNMMLCRGCPTKVSKRRAYLIAALVSLYIPLTTVLSTYYIGGGYIQETADVLTFNRWLLISGELVKILFILFVVNVKWYRIYWITIVISIFNGIPSIWYTETHVEYDHNGYAHIMPISLDTLSQYLLIVLLAAAFLGIYQLLAIVMQKWNPRYRVSGVLRYIIYGGWVYMLLTLTKNYQGSEASKEVPLGTAGNVYELVIFAIVVIASIIIGFYYLDRKLLKKENMMLLDRSEVQYQSFETLRQKELEIRKLYHDMQNHIHTIEYLVADGEHEKATAYAADLTEKYQNVRYQSYCTNPIVDTVLRQKMNRADEYGIHCELDIQLPRDLKIKDIDLVSVFSNLLDNAIESCQRNEATANFIRVNTTMTGDYLAVKIVNSRHAEKTPGVAAFATSKVDKVKHGYGLRIIEEIVVRYEGHKELKEEKEQFTALIMLKAI